MTHSASFTKANALYFANKMSQAIQYFTSWTTQYFFKVSLRRSFKRLFSTSARLTCIGESSAAKRATGNFSENCYLQGGSQMSRRRESALSKQRRPNVMLFLASQTEPIWEKFFWSKRKSSIASQTISIPAFVPCGWLLFVPRGPLTDVWSEGQVALSSRKKFRRERDIKTSMEHETTGCGHRCPSDLSFLSVY